MYRLESGKAGCRTIKQLHQNADHKSLHSGTRNGIMEGYLAHSAKNSPFS